MAVAAAITVGFIASPAQRPLNRAIGVNDSPAARTQLIHPHGSARMR
jgi:hypothetical protein